ncbi:MAG: hypothetical protein EOM59_11755 [Clostridia bacterium]|nr:hypothetical protein [Clostridia bacterium]
MTEQDIIYAAKNFKTSPLLEFLQDKHYYKYNGKFIPSVSSMIKPISSAIYKDIDEAVLEVARNRGTAVHLAIEIYNTKGAEIIEPEFQGYFFAYQAFREEHPNLKLVASELMTQNLSLWYAGTVDELYTDENGDYILNDTKTSVNIERAILIPQLTAYKVALEQQFNIKINETRVLHLKPSGEYAWEKIDTDLNILLSCVSISNFVQKLKWEKK